MRDLRQAWAELMAELDARAPRTQAAIRPPVGSVAALEEALQVTLSDDVRTWFELHNGAGWNFDDGLVLPGVFMLAQADVISRTAMWREVCADDEAPGWSELTSGDPEVAGNIAGTWMPGYLAVADYTCGGGWFVDLRSGPLHGCVRYYMDEMADEFAERVADSLGDLVHGVAVALRTGTPFPTDSHVSLFRDGIVEWGVEAG